MTRFWILLVCIAACSRDAPRELRIDPSAPVRVSFANANAEAPGVTVEVVQSANAIKQGLMFRKELPADHGMLFLMKREKDWSFWMKDTLIPLDMIFITRELTVAGIVDRATPGSNDFRRVGVPSLYVLEVNGGWAERNGVPIGAKVRFENLRL